MQLIEAGREQSPRYGVFYLLFHEDNRTVEKHRHTALFAFVDAFVVY